MPRTYSFDHFTVPKHDTPAQPQDAKARMAAKGVTRGDGRPRYGRRFAETEEMAHVRQMNAQLEELAGVASPKLSVPREPERAERAERPERPMRAERPHRPAPVARLHPGAPIGALPIADATAAATTAPPEPEGFRDLIATGARQLRLLEHCVKDGVAASFHLAMLPLEAAKMTARWMRSGFGLLRPRPA